MFEQITESQVISVGRKGRKANPEITEQVEAILSLNAGDVVAYWCPSTVTRDVQSEMFKKWVAGIRGLVQRARMAANGEVKFATKAVVRKKDGMPGMSLRCDQNDHTPMPDEPDTVEDYEEVI